MFVNMVRATREEARSVARGQVTFVACAACGHVWNRAFEPERLVFDPSYNPDQVGSAAFDRHIADVADRIARACAGMQKVDLLEIGCGQGDFLQQMIDRLGDRVSSARGYDPAFWTTKPRFSDARIRIERSYFDDAALASFDGSANVVITRQAVQHVPEPRGFYRNVRRVMNAPDAKLFVEAPDVTFIFEHRTTYDLFYEHCSLYSPRSMARALRDAGFAVRTIASAFGGQYLVAEASVDPREDTYAAPAGSAPNSLLEADRAFVDGWKRRLAAARERGPVLLWGAGAKGASFSLIVDPGGEAITAIVDINPTKHGRFVPGTGHVIVSPADAAVKSAKTIVIANAIYKEEIGARLRELGAAAEIWTLDDAL
jgi:hypothetical protein